MSPTSTNEATWSDYASASCVDDAAIGVDAERDRWHIAEAGPARADRDRYDRQRRIEGWEQERLRRAHVLVAGAGAIGNETLKLLAQLGVGRVTVIDMDRIEHANLARTVLFRAADVGEPKAVVAARRARAINPDVRVDAVVGDLEHDLGMGLVHEASVVLGCLDNLHARLWLARATRRVGRPFIDAAMDARAASVTIYQPDGPCYGCGLGPRAWRRHRERFSCGEGLLRAARAERVATVATLSSLAAALQVEALLKLLHESAAASAEHPADGQDEQRQGPGGHAPAGLDLDAGERLHISLAPLELARLRLAYRADCPLHEPRWDPPLEAPLDPRASARQLATWLLEHLGAHASAITLTGELVVGLCCPGCQTEVALRVSKRRLTVDRARCPSCCQVRTTSCVEEVALDGVYADEPLEALGVPARAIVEVRLREGGALRVELCGAAAPSAD